MWPTVPRVVRALAMSFGIAAVVVAPSVGITQQALGDATHSASRCATFHAQGTKYGVYIADGKVKCGVAEGILKAIANGKGKVVNNGDSANSWVLYRGWLCPFGNMGEQTCEHDQTPVSDPAQDIASLSCSFGAGCPTRARFLNE